MIAFLTLIENNLQLTLIQIISIVINLGVFIFMARDFRIGVILMMVFNSLTFLLAFYHGLDYSFSLTLLIFSVGLLSLSLYSNNKYNVSGGLTWWILLAGFFC